MFELKVLTDFAAAHQLKMVTEKCENLHGHNWKVEVGVVGGTLDETGVLIDFGELKTLVKAVIEKLDHKFLNELEFFTDRNPSSENIAAFIADQISRSLISRQLDGKGISVSRVVVWESDNACAIFYPQKREQAE